jgi:hypothetical protein
MQISKSPIISGYVVSEKNIFEILSKEAWRRSEKMHPARLSRP